VLDLEASGPDAEAVSAALAEPVAAGFHVTEDGSRRAEVEGERVCNLIHGDESGLVASLR
jgi:hypothetical protein